MSDTSETDDLARGNHVVPTEWAQQLERERDEAREAAAKWESSSDAMERAGAEQARRADENREWALKAERERDEARENLNEEMKFHHRTHAELIQTQCKLLDMEMKCDQLQDEIKRLKVILDLIKKDVS
jgi:hypothetical protein